jgi:hypothetical protein
VKYGIIIVTDNRVAESKVSTPTHAVGQNPEPFFAHLRIFGLLPGNKIPGRSLFRMTEFSAVLPNFLRHSHYSFLRYAQQCVSVRTHQAQSAIQQRGSQVTSEMWVFGMELASYHPSNAYAPNIWT